MAAPEISQTRLYERLTGDEDSRMCKDIPDEACQEQPRNFFLHLMASLGNKLADELASARLVLPWLLGAIGAPVWMVGLLVPIREAGALLPQVFVAGFIRGRPERKGVWVAGALLQALARGRPGPAGLVRPGRARRRPGARRAGAAVAGQGPVVDRHQGRAGQDHRQAAPRHPDGLER